MRVFNNLTLADNENNEAQEVQDHDISMKDGKCKHYVHHIT